MKGSHDLVELFTKEIENRKLDAEVTLAGCFCTGRCNRDGVTIVIDGETYTGITKEAFNSFFEKNVLAKLDS